MENKTPVASPDSVEQLARKAAENVYTDVIQQVYGYDGADSFWNAKKAEIASIITKTFSGPAVPGRAEPATPCISECWARKEINDNHDNCGCHCHKH